MKRIAALALIFLALPALLRAQAYSSQEPSQAGLSSPNVTGMAEDADGNVWIGTVRGLNKYNGSSYVVFYQEEDGLPDDFISALCSDGEGRLWAGTGSGISLIRDGRLDQDFRVSTTRVSQVADWDAGHLIFSTREGLFTADKVSGAVHPVYLDHRLLYNTFIVTQGRHIWVHNTSSSYITVLDDGFRVLREFNIPDRQILGLHARLEGGVCICTDRGILCYDENGNQMPLPTALSRETDGKAVVMMCTDGEDTYIGIRNEGIFKVTPNGLEQDWNEEKLSNVGSCRALLTEDNLWLSKDGREPANLYRHNNEFSLMRPPQLASEALNMFYLLGDGYVMIVSNRLIFRQHIGSGSYRPITGEGLDGSGKLGITLRDRRGYFWIQYNYDELRRYSMDQDRMILENRWPIEPTVCIWDDASGNVCLLQSNGISRFTTDGRREEIPASAHPEFWFCGQFNSGKAYFLADDAVWFLDDGFQFHKLEAEIPEPSCIWEDENGEWWIGTRHSGIWHHSPQTGESRRIDLGGKDVDRSIQSIYGDRNGNIWASSRFDFIHISDGGNTVMILNNPEQEPVRNNTNSLAVTENGTAVFGTHSRFFFFPSDLSSGMPEIPLYLDGMVINGSTTLRDVPEPLVLKHDARQLLFYFSGKNFNPAIVPAYRYKLEGYDTDWIPAGQSLRAGYSGLRSGRYTFRVRVLKPDGGWSGEELVHHVRIMPSPWLAWPALLLYLVLLLTAVWFAMRLYLRTQVNREKLELSEQERALSEQISQERTTFFTNVSHEFRTPLSLIYGPVKELARDESLGDKERELVGIVDRNAERMIRLTDQLLHFSRSRDTLDSLSVMRTDLSVLLRKMLDNFEYMFSQKGLRVSSSIPSGMVAYCDREKVERIVFNLMSNAVKYTPAHGEIDIMAGVEDGRASITVADTGIGISPDKMARIFDRYERVGEKVGDQLPSGFGIGLNYAQHLAHLHKGEISVHSNDPMGSVFTFSFPCRKADFEDANIWQEAAEKQNDTPAEATVADTGGVHILVVEDNPDMREYIRGFLREDYHVTMAGDGEEAWKCIRISAPDLIVSDVMMPYKDGYTLCKEIKNDPEYCHIPVILLTAKADMENQIHGLELGADGYLGKPFDPAFLTALVRNLIAGRQRLQGLLADRTSSSEEPVEDDALSQQDRVFLEKCYRIIDTHLDDEAFGVIGLSMEMGMSRTSIFSKVKALTGQSPQAFLTNYRLNKAMELLKTRVFNISEVAYKVGFATLTGFSRSFKNKFGVPPSAV